jgi:hypothetical protein
MGVALKAGKKEYISLTRSAPPRTARARGELDSSWFRSSKMSETQEAPREGVNLLPPKEYYYRLITSFFQEL